MLILIKFHLTELCTLPLLAAGKHVILEVADEAPSMTAPVPAVML